MTLHLRTQKSNAKSESEASSWHSQNGCEGDGFVWHDGGCHASAK
jgi:hypothetical protein